jgi:hypothetical protein
MWETTVQVARERVARAAPEHAWSLVGESAAWSLRPGRFAFDLTALPETGRLRCALGPAGGGPAGGGPAGKGMGCAVLEVSDEVPGQSISLRSRGTQPIGRQILTLSVVPHDRGCTVRVAVEITVLREWKAETKAFWRKELAAWSDALKDVVEGQRPWPEPGIPAPVLQACAARPLLADPQSVSVPVLIGAPLGVVWEAVLAPGTLADLAASHGMARAGRVPGTPARQPGEMQYGVARQGDGRLTAAVYVLRELADRRSALTQATAPPYFEQHHAVRPADGGTLLTLTLRWPDAPVTEEGEQLRSHLAQAAARDADAYRAAIERPAGVGGAA